MTLATAEEKLSAALSLFASVDIFRMRREETAQYVEQIFSFDPAINRDRFTQPKSDSAELIHCVTLLCLDNYQELVVLRRAREGVETTSYGIFVYREAVFMTMEAEDVVTLLSTSTPSEERFDIATVEMAVKRAEELARLAGVPIQMAVA